MSKFKLAISYWRLVFFKASGKAINAAIMSLVATLNGVDWGNFTSTQKFVAVATALGAMWMVIDAYLDQGIAELEGRPQQIRETAISTTTKIQESSNP